MKSARLNARWHGHQIGSLVHGKEADRAIAAGRAEEVEPPKRRKIRTGTATPSPTRATPTEENDGNDGDPAG